MNKCISNTHIYLYVICFDFDILMYLRILVEYAPNRYYQDKYRTQFLMCIVCTKMVLVTVRDDGNNKNTFHHLIL